VLIDTLLWFACLLVLGLVFWAVQPAVEAFSALSSQWQVAIWTFALFILNWGYFTLFEAFWNGRTPGKRIAGIRVIQRSGRPIGFLESLARNLVRYVDQIPFFYAVGVIVMFITRQHQRLGDLAAGTLVVRDGEPEPTPWNDSPTRTFTAQIFPRPAAAAEPHTLVSLPAESVSRLSSADLEVLEGFFARRLDMSLATRQALAERISAALCAKSGLEVPPGVSTETFLEATARDLRDLGRLR
jgi:uncharacterized RDD family membrane protein YckC